MKLILEMLSNSGTLAMAMGAIGVVSTAWAILHLIGPPKASSKALQLACSLIPACLGVSFFYEAFRSFRVVAESLIAPKKEEFDHFATYCIVYGMLSTLCTVVPASLGTIGLLRRQSSKGL